MGASDEGVHRPHYRDDPAGASPRPMIRAMSKPKVRDRGSRRTLRPDPAGGFWVRLPLSEQSVDLLHQLAARGIYGATPEEVAARFVDEKLQDFCPPPVLGRDSRDDR